MKASTSSRPQVIPIRVAFVTHVLSPHRLALMECVASGLADFMVFLSEAEDKLHKFPPPRGTLQVTLQRSVNWQHKFRNVHGYKDVSHVHMPIDTYSQLRRYQPDVVISTELGIAACLLPCTAGAAQASAWFCGRLCLSAPRLRAAGSAVGSGGGSSQRLMLFLLTARVERLTYGISGVVGPCTLSHTRSTIGRSAPKYTSRSQMCFAFFTPVSSYRVKACLHSARH